MTTKLRTTTCTVCGDEFAQPAKRGRPRTLCSPACQTKAKADSVSRYRETENYREAVKRATQHKKETYNPWLWENTILEWNE